MSVNYVFNQLSPLRRRIAGTKLELILSYILRMYLEKNIRYFTPVLLAAHLNTSSYKD